MSENNLPSAESANDYEIDQSNPQMMQAYRLIAETNQCFFLTGRAGTGKTTFLRAVRKLVDKRFAVVAPTGIAAIVAGGATVHSFFGLDINLLGPDAVGKYLNDAKREVIRECDTVIIDEVSMLRCDVLDALERTMRMVNKTNMPFGGKQVVFVGDLFQLPPVLKAGEETEAMMDLYGTASPYFFKAKALEKLPLPTIELLKVYRQDEPEFLDLLDAVRHGVATEADLGRLNRRNVAPPADSVVTLTPYRSTAAKINEERLQRIEAPEYQFDAKVEGRFAKADKNGEYPESSLPAPQHLHLKVGAQVMFVRNDPGHRWVNGTIGHVVEFYEDGIRVKIGDQEVGVTLELWQTIEYKYNRTTRQLDEEVTGIFEQYPLRLAWGITIHKSQGLTLDDMVLDLNRGAFACGQLYVALSRVRTLGGLFLTRNIRLGDVRTDREVVNYAKSFNNEGFISQQISDGTTLFEYIKKRDHDGAALCLMEQAKRKLRNGDGRGAATTFKQMLDTMYFDDALYGTCNDVPLCDVDNAMGWFNNAVVALYGGHEHRVVEYADKILQTRQLYEALYLKVRALHRCGMTDDADDLNIEIASLLEQKNKGGYYDTKFIQSCIEVNRAVGDAYLGLIQMVLRNDRGYLPALRMMHASMQTEQLQLHADGTFKLPKLAKAFNKTADSDAFIAQVEPLVGDKKYDQLIDNILHQYFSDEDDGDD